jgi:phage protein D
MIPHESVNATTLLITVNGILIEGLLHATLTTSNCFAADTYALGFAMGPPPMGDVTFWSSIESGYVEIAAASDFRMASQAVLSGMIDTVSIDPIREMVAIEGRDLSSSLIDSYRQQSFVNQTASEVVATIAQTHGLLPVITPTNDSVGRYYGDGYTRLSLGDFSKQRSDWDLLVQLARENSFDVFVEGRTLFFQPSSAIWGVPVRLAPSDVLGMRIERNLVLPSDTSARVQSWNSQNMASYASDDGADGLDPASLTSSASRPPYLFSASNLTQQQAANSADRYAAELGRLSTMLHIEMPWDLTLKPRMLILLSGTGSVLDNIYRLDAIDRHYSSATGSTQCLRASLI